MYVESSYTNRTYVSSLYQLMGMFPDYYPNQHDIAFYKIGSEDYLSPIQKQAAQPNFTVDPSKVFQVVRGNHSTDYLLHVDDENCFRYSYLQYLTENCEEREKIEEFFVRNY